jgi:hypothetical protein
VPSQFNTLVQGLSIASITPQQILAAGSPIFLDIKTSSDINSINTLIQSYARIHAPTYGQPNEAIGMPRRAPDQVQEMRITFGNYEREFVTEVKNDIEKGVKIAAITAAAVPLATVGGLGLLGYGIYKGASMIGKGLNEFSAMDWKAPSIVTDIKDAWTGIKWGIDPTKPPAPGEENWSLDGIDNATKDYSWFQKQELWLYIISGGVLGKSHDQLRAEIDG